MADADEEDGGLRGVSTAGCRPAALSSVELQEDDAEEGEGNERRQWPAGSEPRALLRRAAREHGSASVVWRWWTHGCGRKRTLACSTSLCSQWGGRLR